MSVELRGADQLASLSRQLKELGDRGLTREFSRAVTDAVKPLRAEVQASARQTLPHHGGLNEKVARSKFRTVRRPLGIRVQVASSYSLRRLDQGRLRHPVFGNRDKWVDQLVTPGWWTRPTEAAVPAVQRAVQDAMDAMVRRLNQL